MSLRSKLAAALVSLSFAWIPQAFSQGLGSLVGSVTDPPGGVVANAKVTATESEASASRGVVTDSAGIYVIPGLRPTTYLLTVQAPGFKGYTQRNILLMADQSVTADVKLSL